jgi:DHA1 family tetracycline resistance protein-like MFS transporter
MGTAQSLVAVTDIVSPVLAGFVVGQALYGAWIGAIVAIGVIGGATAYCLLPRLDVESAAR